MDKLELLLEQLETERKQTDFFIEFLKKALHKNLDTTIYNPPTEPIKYNPPTDKPYRISIVYE